MKKKGNIETKDGGIVSAQALDMSQALHKEKVKLESGDVISAATQKL
jgi:hypothetical protein